MIFLKKNKTTKSKNIASKQKASDITNVIKTTDNSINLITNINDNEQNELSKFNDLEKTEAIILKIEDKLQRNKEILFDNTIYFKLWQEKYNNFMMHFSHLTSEFDFKNQYQPKRSSSKDVVNWNAQHEILKYYTYGLIPIINKKITNFDWPKDLESGELKLIKKTIFESINLFSDLNKWKSRKLFLSK